MDMMRQQDLDREREKLEDYLLDKAIVKPRKQKYDVSDDLSRKLAIAFLKDQATAASIGRAVAGKHVSQSYYWIAVWIRDMYRDGLITIKEGGPND